MKYYDIPSLLVASICSISSLALYCALLRTGVPTILRTRNYFYVQSSFLHTCYVYTKAHRHKHGWKYFNDF